MNTETESPFRISHIQPCGSMEEKSSILKSESKPYDYNGVRLIKYIEFDYLAILDKPDIKLEGSCPGCRYGFELPIDFDNEDVFNRQLRRSIASLCTVKPVLSGHSKQTPKLVFNTNYSLMLVKSIAECSNGSILQYLWPSFSYHFPLRPLFCLFLSGRLRQVLL